MQRPYLPLFVGDYLAKTGHLTTLQHGAYFLLLIHYWANGELPPQPEALMAIARMTPDEWSGNCHVLAKFFDSRWRNKRMEKELARFKDISEKRSLSGLKGAWSKHNSYNSHSLANATIPTPTYKKEERGSRVRKEDLTPSQTEAFEILRRRPNGR